MSNWVRIDWACNQPGERTMTMAIAPRVASTLRNRTLASMGVSPFGRYSGSRPREQREAQGGDFAKAESHTGRAKSFGEIRSPIERERFLPCLAGCTQR